MGNQPWFECFASLLDIELSTGIESMHYLEQTCFDSYRIPPLLLLLLLLLLISLLCSRPLDIYLEEFEPWSMARTRKSWNKRLENNDHFIIITTTQAISLPCMIDGISVVMLLSKS